MSLDDANAGAGADAAQAAEGGQAGGEAARPEGELGGGAGGAEGQAPAEGDKPEGQPKPDDKPARPNWAHRRIDELTGQRYAEQRRAEQAERERDEMRGRLAAYEERQRQQQGQGGQGGQGDPQQGQGRQPQSRMPTQQEFDDAVNRRAAEQARLADFNRGANAAFDEGVKAYGEQPFRQSLQTLGQALGGLPPALVEAAMETGSAAAVLHALGQEPEEAQRIMSLSPLRMAVAVQKIASRPAPAAPAVSRAPAPLKPIAGQARGSKNPDEMSTAEWIAARREGKIK